MKNIKIETGAGDMFLKVAEKAKRVATEKTTNCEFDFNGITVIVSADTNLELLNRDYGNSFIMGWKTIGPICNPLYSFDTEHELNKRTEAKEAEQKQRRILYHLKEKEDRRIFSEKIKGIDFQVVDVEIYQNWKDKNNDGYGAACFEYAECWAMLMQKELSQGKQIKYIAEKTSNELGFMGITGFMYGMAVNILSRCWVHGEDLRKWHNKEYNHEGDGVVNPAILTISNK